MQEVPLQPAVGAKPRFLDLVSDGLRASGPNATLNPMPCQKQPDKLKMPSSTYVAQL